MGCREEHGARSCHVDLARTLGKALNTAFCTAQFSFIVVILVPLAATITTPGVGQVAQKDDESFGLTFDRDPGRIDVVINAGKITHAVCPDRPDPMNDE